MHQKKQAFLDFIPSLHTCVVLMGKKGEEEKGDRNRMGKCTEEGRGIQEDRNKGGKSEELDLKEQRKESEGQLHNPSSPAAQQTHQQQALTSTRPSSPPLLVITG